MKERSEGRKEGRKGMERRKAETKKNKLNGLMKGGRS